MDEIEFIARQASNFGDKCRAFLWTRAFLTIKANDGFRVEINMPENHVERCRKVICNFGYGCKNETKSTSFRYLRLCAQPKETLNREVGLYCEFWAPHAQFYWQPVKREWLHKHPDVSSSFGITLTGLAKVAFSACNTARFRNT